MSWGKTGLWNLFGPVKSLLCRQKRRKNPWNHKNKSHHTPLTVIAPNLVLFCLCAVIFFFPLHCTDWDQMDSMDERWKERLIRKDKHLRQEAKKTGRLIMLLCSFLNNETTDIKKKHNNAFHKTKVKISAMRLQPSCTGDVCTVVLHKQICTIKFTPVCLFWCRIWSTYVFVSVMSTKLVLQHNIK